MKTNSFTLTLTVVLIVLLVSMVGCGAFQAQPTSKSVPTSM